MLSPKRWSAPKFHRSIFTVRSRKQCRHTHTPSSDIDLDDRKPSTSSSLQAFVCDSVSVARRRASMSVTTTAPMLELPRDVRRARHADRDAIGRALRATAQVHPNRARTTPFQPLATTAMPAACWPGCCLRLIAADPPFFERTGFCFAAFVFMMFLFTLLISAVPA